MDGAQAAVDGNDVRTGRVLMLNPGYLLGAGAHVLCTKAVNPLGGGSPHYFVCIHVAGNKSYWCPLSSNWKNTGSPSQGTITIDQKIGFGQFIQKDSWYDKEQFWEIDNDKVVHYALSYPEINKTKGNGARNEVRGFVVGEIFGQTQMALEFTQRQ